jgi:hypothetical protein
VLDLSENGPPRVLKISSNVIKIVKVADKKQLLTILDELGLIKQIKDAIDS